MAERIIAVVGGFDALAAALVPVPAFERVIPVNSTEELRTLIAGNQIPKDDPGKIIFIFADTLLVNTPQDLNFLVSRLTAIDRKVVIVEVSPAATDLVAANPKAGLLRAPFRVNDVLFAVSSMGTSAGMLDPYEQGFDVIPPPALDWGAASAASQPVVVTSAPPAPRSEAPAAPPSPSPAPPPPPPPPMAPPSAPPPPPPPSPTPPPPPSAPITSSEWQMAPPPGFDAPPRPAPAPAPAPTPRRDVSPGVYTAPTLRPLGPRPGSQEPSHYTGPHADNCKVIAVASPKGGTGKSTLSLNLAVYLGMRLHKYGKRVCLIDANFQQADAGKMLDSYKPNVTHIAKDRASIVPGQIERYLVHRPDLNLSALLGPPVPTEASPALYTGALYNSILDALRPNYDYVFIDTPVAELFHDIFENFVLPRSDYIVVPITPAYHTIMNVDAWLSSITQPTRGAGANVDPSKIGIIVNQARDNVGITLDDIRQELYHWRYLGSIPDTAEMIRALNENEIIATKNIHELNVAFSTILYAVTGEHEMAYGMDLGGDTSSSRRGLLSKFRRR